MDIRPPKRPQPSAQPSSDLPTPETVPTSSEVSTNISSIPLSPSADAGPTVQRKNSFAAKRVVLIMAVVLGLIIAMVCGFFWWTLQPVGGDGARKHITINSGEALQSIAQNLEDQDLIRSAFTFEWYARAIQAYPNIKAGGFFLSSQQSVPDILAKITSDNKDVYSVTIAPGLTLDELADPSIKNSLAWQGFTKQEIQDAYSANYSSPLLRDKPSNATLEGYIFPETYQMSSDQTLIDVFDRTFDELYSRMKRDKLLDAFAVQGLNIHQAMTLASIVQKEVQDETDQKQVAQVFLKRYKEGIMLGSDVTFMYAAKQMGVEPTVEIDSVYNTRKYSGLPPGPISNMNYSALKAVAFPAAGDYLYFVAGDDGKTYFSRTESEHEASVAAHCTTLCQ